MADDDKHGGFSLADALGSRIQNLASEIQRTIGDLDSHEKVCTERYKNINDRLTDISTQLSALSTTTNHRLDAISSRLWAGVVGALSLSVVGLAGTVFYLLTKK